MQEEFDKARDPTSSESTTLNTSSRQTQEVTLDPFPPTANPQYSFDTEQDHPDTLDIPKRTPRLPSQNEVFARLPQTNLKRIINFGCNYLFLGAGCQSLTPTILIAIIITIYHYFDSYLNCSSLNWIKHCLKILVVIFLYDLVKTAFSNPGHIIRKEPVEPLPSSYYKCELCWVTREEARERGVVHCEDCEVCVYEYDHHCIVLGNCIGGKNLRNFNLLIVIFMVSVFFSYFSLFMALWKCGEDGIGGGDGKKASGSG